VSFLDQTTTDYNQILLTTIQLLTIIGLLTVIEQLTIIGLQSNIEMIRRRSILVILELSAHLFFSKSVFCIFDYAANLLKYNINR